MSAINGSFHSNNTFNNINEEFPYSRALKEGNSVIAQKLSEIGLGVNSNLNANAALNVVVKQCSQDSRFLEVVRFLVERCGANPINVSDCNECPIWLAIGNGCESAVLEYLLSYDADPNQQNDEEQNVLAVHLMKMVTINFDLVRDLLVKQVDINCITKEGTVLSAVLKGDGNIFPGEDGMLDSIQLVEPTHLDAKMQRVEKMYWYLRGNGAYILPSDAAECVIDAARLGAVSILQDLYGYFGIQNFNVGDVNGKRPLHHASELGNVDAVKFLLKHGASPNLKDINGNTAVNLAKDEATQKIFVEFQSGESALATSSENIDNTLDCSKDLGRPAKRQR